MVSGKPNASVTFSQRTVETDGSSSKDGPIATAESNRSARSWKSWDTDGERGSSSVHENLMRTQTKRDPMTVYEVVKELGEGSMGSVCKVKKREEAKGGSARQSFVAQSSRNESKLPECCFPVLSFFKLKPSTSKLIHPSHHSTVSSLGASGRDSDSTDNNAKTSYERKTSQLITYGSNRDSLYALKSIHLDRCTDSTFKDELVNEVNILKGLDHPNIVKAIETFDYDGRLFLVLELCSGGDLYVRDPYTEDQACKIVHSLLSAVAFLHDHGIVHRDLKYENIMFSSTNPNAEIKLIDFGLSQKFAKDEHLKDAVGTIYTMAPELIKGDYDAKADVWSIGVIAFMLLSSSMPFFGKTREQVMKKIIKGKFKFGGERWAGIESEAKVFVRDLLEYNAKKRPTADQALRLCWMDREVEFTERSGSDGLDEAFDKVQANIQAFAEYSKLKKLALMVVAYKSSSEEIGILKKLFSKFDSLKNGVISLEEFREALSQRYEYSNEEIERLFNGIDIDGTGTVHYVEFLAASLESLGSIDEERLAEAFDRIDSSDTGYITVSDLRDFLGQDIPTEYLNEIIQEADILRDRRVSYEEFLALWSVESDAKLKEAKAKVYGKRMSKLSSVSFDSQTSITPASSFDESDDFGSSHDEALRDSSGKADSSPFDGVISFAKQKEMSVRLVSELTA